VFILILFYFHSIFGVGSTCKRLVETCNGYKHILFFQLQGHCNSSRCSVVNFELSFFPSHVEEERLHAFRPLIIQVTVFNKQCLAEH
jgi:hypothetical protein